MAQTSARANMSSCVCHQRLQEPARTRCGVCPFASMNQGPGLRAVVIICCVILRLVLSCSLTKTIWYGGYFRVLSEMIILLILTQVSKRQLP